MEGLKEALRLEEMQILDNTCVDRSTLDVLVWMEHCRTVVIQDTSLRSLVATLSVYEKDVQVDTLIIDNHPFMAEPWYRLSILRHDTLPFRDVKNLIIRGIECRGRDTLVNTIRASCAHSVTFVEMWFCHTACGTYRHFDV